MNFIFHKYIFKNVGDWDWGYVNKNQRNIKDLYKTSYSIKFEKDGDYYKTTFTMDIEFVQITHFI